MFITGKYYAVELFTSGRDADAEFEEMRTFVEEGTSVQIVEDYTELDAELIVRDYL